MPFHSRRLYALALPLATTAAAFAFAGNATAEPSIAKLSWMPPAPQATEPVTVIAKVTDTNSTPTVSVAYTTANNGAPTTVEAVDDGTRGDAGAGDSVYGATIPPQPAGTKVTFHWSTKAADGSTSTSASRSYISGRPAGPEFRGIWIDSWNSGFLSTTQTEELLKTCRMANINTIFPEVRKVGDAYYESKLEPRANNIAGGQDFDPLGHLIQQAHDTSNGNHKLQVHGWFVMQRIGAPSDPQHILARHPEYEMLKSDGTHGTSMKTRYLDPGHPGAVEHNVAVILDCLDRYDLDGVHFDYIRYPEEQGDWGYNQTSVERFNALHGTSGPPSPTDPEWCAWRRECISLQVRKIYVKAWQKKPNVLLSASTINWGHDYDQFEKSRAYNQAFQDWAAWLEQGNFDYNGLMNYVSDSDPARFLGWTNCSVSRNKLRGSIIGAGVYLSSSIQGAIDQLKYVRASGAAGMNIYDWGSEVEGNKKGETREQFYAALKDQLFTAWVNPPEASWKKNPKTGILEGNVTSQGKPVDHARIWIDGKPETETVTDGMGWFAILNVPEGTHALRLAKKGVGEQAVPGTESKPGRITTVNLTLDNSSNTKAAGSQ